MSETKVRAPDAMAAVFGNSQQQTQNLPAVTGANFNPDAFHAMQARDDQLIADNLVHGYTGKEFVYSFEIQGKKVTGISVVGARQLASFYGGIKARIVASVDKTDSLFVFKSFDPMDVRVQSIPQLSSEPDFYEVVMEVTDLKTGSSIMVRKKETKKEQRRDKTWYDRPHYDVIAESKAYRNGVLSILPQDILAKFEARALEFGNVSQEKTMQQLRDGALAFAAKNGIAIDRHALEELTYPQIMGLGNATKDMGQFKEALIATGLLTPVTRTETQEQINTTVAARKAAAAEKISKATTTGTGEGAAPPPTTEKKDPDNLTDRVGNAGATPPEGTRVQEFDREGREAARAPDQQKDQTAPAAEKAAPARRSNPMKFE